MTSKSSGKENLLGSGGKYHANGDANGGDVSNGHVNHAFCEIPLESSNGTLKKVRIESDRLLPREQHCRELLSPSRHSFSFTGLIELSVFRTIFIELSV